MGQAIPRQHPAVVLRSHYRQLRTLLALALVVLAGLSVALVFVANDDEGTTGASLAKPGEPIEYGNFNPQTGRPLPDVATPNIAANPPIEYGGFNPQTGRPAVNGATPDESSIAAAISGARQSAPSGPDEANVASAIANGTAALTGSRQSAPGGPDEANIASAIGNGTADPSVSQAHPGPRP
jgi:hypothetical protein